MNTKYFTRLIMVLVLVVGFNSCKKYLDQRPKTEVDTQAVFKDVPSTYKALAAVYSRLTGDQGFGIRLSLYYPVDNDEMQGPTAAPTGDDRRSMARYQLQSGNVELEKPFNQLFQGIDYANICIANIPAMPMYTSGTDEEKKKLRRMYGEALTLRAQFYFEAVKHWGDLPLHFTPAAIQALTDPFPSRADRDTIYARILDDLKTAEDLVPWRNEVTGMGDQVDERITKGSVKGLRARIALFRGGWALRQNGSIVRGSNYLTYYQIAKDECNSIIQSGQHNLNPDFKALWKNQVCAHAIADPDGELMFQVSGIGLTGAEDTKLGYYNGPRVNNLGNSSINPLPTYLYLFDSTDKRRDVTIAHYFTSTTGTRTGQVITNMNDGKYRRDWITNPSFSPTDAVQYFGLKWQLLRYSDVLLMFAEAENELSGAPTAAAYTAINQVRRRGFGKPINTPNAAVDIPAGLSKTDFFKAIVRERALELAGEGIRKFDLIRWKLLETAINETKANLLRMANSQAMVNPTYMSDLPPYCLSATLPTSMYAINNTTSDDNNIGGLWANSLYKPAPAATPAGTTKITWIGAAVNTTALARYASGFASGKSELFPLPQAARDANINLTQNPLYQ